MRIRKANARVSYDSRRQAYDNYMQESAAAASSDPRDNCGSVQPSQNVAKHRPSRPRILDLSNDTNVVGINQQFGGVEDEQYGFFTVVNDAFFDGGPKVNVVEKHFS